MAVLRWAIGGPLRNANLVLMRSPLRDFQGKSWYRTGCALSLMCSSKYLIFIDNFCLGSVCCCVLTGLIVVI
ncbi:hypothetical protein PUN4_600102 [Paraburkholderia unamae]|nr:hypothetical protein PUN4_600102 [Paraburkholderia unamae]